MDPRVLYSVDEIGQAAWETLDAPSPFVSYGWLSTVERTAVEPPAFRYIALYDDADLVGAIVAEIVAPDARAGTLDRIMLGRAAAAISRYGVSFEPALVCSAYDGYGTTLLLRRSAAAAERKRIRAGLLAALRGVAHHERLSVAFCGVLADEEDLARELAADGFHRTLQWPVARMVPKWSSFEGYLAAMRLANKSVAKDIRRERNRLRESGTTIEQFTPQPSDVPRLHALAAANYEKYGDETFPYRTSFFTTLTERSGGDAVWYGAWKSGRLVAFSLMLEVGDRAWGTYFGCDYEACGDDRTYFNLIFNRPIEDAAKTGLTSLYFGRGLHALKRRRGCESVPSHVFYRARQPLRNVLLGPGLSLRSRYVARKDARAHWSGAGRRSPKKP